MKKRTFILVLSIITITGTSFGYLHQMPVPHNENTFLYVSGDDPADAQFPEGAKIYKEKCVACHQATGLGVPNAFPPLKGSDYLLADKKRAVKQVLNGSNEEITVNGVTYSIPMPFQVNTHEEAVHVINYVLNAWGNNGGTITVEEAKDIKIVRP